jgi:hypothetical protein
MQKTSIDLPSPTVWPFVLAFGVALTFTGLATHAWISVFGLVLAVCAAVGWFRDVLPHEAHEPVIVSPQVAPMPNFTQPSRVVSRVVIPFPTLPAVANGDPSRAAVPRAVLPRESYPVSAGLRGGLAGAAVMATLAMSYGAISGTSVWYPINLLVAGFLPRSTYATTANLQAFSVLGLALATVIHLIASLLVGLLYGVMLPMLPRRPVLLGGIVAPLFWSGLVHGLLGIVNPVMNQRIDWPWFVLSQIGFGIAAGVVVSRLARIPTAQLYPFVVRAGIETPGLMRERERR